MEYANSRIERLKAKVEDTDRDFGRLKLRSHSKFNKIAQVSGELRQIETLVDGFNATLVQSKQYTENKIKTVDAAANENSKSINIVSQALRNLERQVSLNGNGPCCLNVVSLERVCQYFVDSCPFGSTH